MRLTLRKRKPREQIPIGAIVDGSEALGERARELDIWPVDRSDLDAEIRRFTAERGWKVLKVGEPPLRRGPFPMTGTNPETGEEVRWLRWQLYAWVLVEKG